MKNKLLLSLLSLSLSVCSVTAFASVPPYIKFVNHTQAPISVKLDNCDATDCAIIQQASGAMWSAGETKSLAVDARFLLAPKFTKGKSFGLKFTVFQSNQPACTMSNFISYDKNGDTIFTHDNDGHPAMTPLNCLNVMIVNMTGPWDGMASHMDTYVGG